MSALSCHLAQHLQATMHIYNHELSSTVAVLQTSLSYPFQKDGMNPGYSTRPLRFSNLRHTNCQTTTGELGKTTIGKILMDGGGLHHCPCGDHRHCLEQSAIAAAATSGVARNCLWIEDRRFMNVKTFMFSK